MSNLTTLMHAHNDALAEYDRTSDEEWKTQGDRIGEILDRTRDAVLDHRPANLEEVATKVVYMTTNRTFHEWDDVDRIRLIRAFLPIEGDTRS